MHMLMIHLVCCYLVSALVSHRTRTFSNLLYLSSISIIYVLEYHCDIITYARRAFVRVLVFFVCTLYVGSIFPKIRAAPQIIHIYKIVCSNGDPLFEILLYNVFQFKVKTHNCLFSKHEHFWCSCSEINDNVNGYLLNDINTPIFIAMLVHQNYQLLSPEA